MSDFILFQSISSKFLVPFDGYVAMSSALVTTVLGIIVAVVLIKTVWFGLETTAGKSSGGGNVFTNFFFDNIHTYLVIALALANGAYMTNVVGGINELQNELINFFGGAPNGLNQFQALDASMAKIFMVFKEIWKTAQNHISFGVLPNSKVDFTGVIMIIQGFFMAGFFGLYALAAAVEMTVLAITLKILFAIGPLFVGCFAFKSTAKFFDSWLNFCLKAVLTGVIISIMIGLGNSIFTDYATNISKNVDSLELLTIGLTSMFACLFLYIMIKRVPEIAGQLTGGVALSPSGYRMGAPAAAAATAASAVAGGVGRAGAFMLGNSSLGEKMAGSGGEASGGGSSKGSYVGDLMRSVATSKNMSESFAKGFSRREDGTGTINGRPLNGPP